MNVLLDANVWISAFLNPFGYPAPLRAAWLKNRFVVVVSPSLLEEIRATLTDSRLVRKYTLSGAEVEGRNPNPVGSPIPSAPEMTLI